MHHMCTWDIHTALHTGDVSFTLFVSDQFFFCIVKEMQGNKVFRRGVKNWTQFLCSPENNCGSIGEMIMISQTSLNLANNCRNVIRFKMVACKETKLKLQKEILWWCLLHPMIVLRIQLEYMVASLSTLGGAYSAMGDFYEQHSIKAGVVSRQQYIVATVE